jgi:alkylhydroperoxidase/carboxymuconolactone decarboxylase family protein YurZ
VGLVADYGCGAAPGDGKLSSDPNREKETTMAETNAPVLESLVRMNEGVLERSGLDEETFMLVRIAALASSGAPPASYLVNLGAASELGLSLEQVQGVLIAIAPVVGSARVAGAGGSILKALGFATAVVEEAEMEEST